MSDERWIVVPNWPRFQHYTDRDPIWIKDYVSQLHDDDWARLTFAERGVLQTCRLMFAASDGRVTFGTILEAQMSPQRRANEHLASLIEAGLIDVRASRPLALARSREKSREEKNERASKPTSRPREPRRGNEPAVELEPAGDVIERALPDVARAWLDEHTPRRRPDDDASGTADDNGADPDELF